MRNEPLHLTASGRVARGPPQDRFRLPGMLSKSAFPHSFQGRLSDGPIRTGASRSWSLTSDGEPRGSPSVLPLMDVGPLPASRAHVRGLSRRHPDRWRSPQPVANAPDVDHPAPDVLRGELAAQPARVAV